MKWLTLAGPLGVLCLTLLFAAWLRAEAPSQNAVRGGETIVEAPTLLSLGVRWTVTGDANRNAHVYLKYRPVTPGRPPRDTDWRSALPLFRVDGAALLQPLPAGASLFAGSVF